MGFDFAFWISPGGRIFKVPKGEDHDRVILLHPERFGFSTEETRRASGSEDIRRLSEIAIAQGWTRYRLFDRSNNFQVDSIERALPAIESVLVKIGADLDDRVMVAELPPEGTPEKMYVGTVADVYDKTIGSRVERNPRRVMPATLSAFGRRLRKVINRPDVFGILAEGDWGAGGCWILAEALARFLGPPARILAVGYPGRVQVDHVVVEYGDVYIDYLGAQTEDELRRNLAKERPGMGVPFLVPFTKRLQRVAEATGIPCDPTDVKRLLSVLHEAFPG